VVGIVSADAATAAEASPTADEAMVADIQATAVATDTGVVTATEVATATAVVMATVVVTATEVVTDTVGVALDLASLTHGPTGVGITDMGTRIPIATPITAAHLPTTTRIIRVRRQASVSIGEAAVDGTDKADAKIEPRI